MNVTISEPEQSWKQADGVYEHYEVINGQVRELPPKDTLEGDPLLPGFRMTLSDLFPESA